MHNQTTMELITFTRYLYPAEHVQDALVRSLLQKNIQQSLFWAFELLHSGLLNHIHDTVWNLYNTHLATFNPRFKTYINTKINIILQNGVEIDETSAEIELPYESQEALRYLVHNLLLRIRDIPQVTPGWGSGSGSTKSAIIRKNNALCQQDTRAHKTKHKCDTRPLSLGSKYERHEPRLLLRECAHFNVGGSNPVPQDVFYYHWLYHSHECPLWERRIEFFRGSVNHQHKKIDFCDDDLEAFFTEYGLEPDEQPIHIEHACRGIQ